MGFKAIVWADEVLQITQIIINAESKEVNNFLIAELFRIKKACMYAEGMKPKGVFNF